MIDFIYGKLREVWDKKIVVETGGVGFLIQLPLSSIQSLTSIDDDIKVYTYMAVKEDDISLYGFLKREDKDMFLQLISCDGVGPKGAMNIISELGVSVLVDAIVKKDDKTISKVPGIGSKTASKICIELCDKVKKTAFYATSEKDQGKGQGGSRLSDISDEAIKALIKLGYKNKEAKDMVSKVDIEVGDTTEDVLQKVLRKR